MASKRRKQIITQPETQDTVMISKKTKAGNDGDSEEISNSISLPHDLVINDILTRVPVDSLMRFKCVCKLWLNLISNDAKFMNMHARKSGTHGFGLMYLSSSYTGDDSRVGRKIDEFNGVIKSDGIVFCNIDKKEKKVFHFKPQTGLVNRKIVIRHSLNGLVLLSRQEDTFGFTHHVFNPITGNLLELPVLNDIARRVSGFYLHLAYDTAAGKYKVVCFYKRMRELIFKIVTVDVRSGSWRNIVALSSPCLLDDYEAVFANGSLNWLTHDRYGTGGYKADQGKILCLDVSEEKFYTIDYPKGVPDKCQLLEMGGSLCFLSYGSTGKIKLWVLKENGEKQRKGNQCNEWLEWNVDILQNNDVLKLFHNLDNFHCVAVVKNPKLKIIFWTANRRILDEPEERGFSRFYTTEFYSYDVDLKTFASISKHTGIFVKWDLNSLVHFNQPLLVSLVEPEKLKWKKQAVCRRNLQARYAVD